MPYYFNVRAFKEEIESDNNIIKWNNSLLGQRRDELLHKERGLEYYNKIFTNLPFTPRAMEEIAGLGHIHNGLKSFSINILDEKCSDNCTEKMCLLWSDVNISFICRDEQHIFALMDNISNINSISVQSMNIERAGQQTMSVNLVLRSYHLKTL